MGRIIDEIIGGVMVTGPRREVEKEKRAWEELHNPPPPLPVPAEHVPSSTFSLRYVESREANLHWVLIAVGILMAITLTILFPALLILNLAIGGGIASGGIMYLVVIRNEL